MGYDVTEVQKVLKGVDYPASGDRLADHASANGADGDLVESLRSIGGEVDGPSGVMQRMKGELGDG